MTVDPDKKKRMMTYRWIVFAVLALAYFFVYFHRVSGGAANEEIIAAWRRDSVNPILEQFLGSLRAACPLSEYN